MGILAIACAFGIIAVADDASAAEVLSLEPKDKDYAKVSGSLTYVLTYEISENATLSGALLDEDEKEVGSACSCIV